MSERYVEFQPPKLVVMPPRESMVSALKKMGVWGISKESDNVLLEFVARTADRKKAGSGLAVNWWFAVGKHFQGYPAQVLEAMDSHFGVVVETVTPDEEVASQAKSFLDEVKQWRKSIVARPGVRFEIRGKKLIE